ncbi:flavin reductase family protein [Tabrizicola oligotrophica]|uniref:Flavin reductase n=1 Tax=Tabrizicola oligotrophica TaxID=2710650 RepID=A0A6M0QRY9_9RHOB|nr:flavin reductase family protein [Tabrizicola oligotrophica]NEY90245.1 flavin reductase [Tabrizicola oligotrophica]
MTAPIEAAAFRAAMSRFPGAVTIVTTGSGENRRGITATAVCSVTADPPSLLVCLNRKTGTCAAVAESGAFAVNLLPGDGGPLALAFAGATGATGESKFATGDWQADERGLPRLASAVASFSCEVTDEVQAGTHSLFIGRVLAVTTGEGAPLLYEQSRFHLLQPV